MREAIRLPPLPKSVTEARRFVAGHTGDLPRPVRDALELCVSELAANCVLHAITHFTVTVIRDGKLCVEVADVGLGSVQPRAAHDNDLRGRGLRIVAALADSWGVRPAQPPPGKTVWIEFDLAQAAAVST